MKKLELLFKILAVISLVVILILAVLSPRWAARPEDVRAAAPTPIPTWAPSPTPEPTPTPNVTPTQEPTPEPTATPTPEPTPEIFTVSLVGDCTMASYPEIRAWDISYENVVGEDYGYPFKNTKDIFSADDMSIINLECSISDLQAWSASTFSFEAGTGTLQSLTDGSIEFATTANNHAMDFGLDVYNDTTANLDSVGIGHCGDGEGAIYITNSGLSVGVYATFNGNWPDANQVSAGVKALKDQGAEVVVVSAHWGDEASYYTNENQRTVAHAAIDAGANIIMGSGPHRLEPFEEYNGAIIFYSLGNFIFGGNTLPADMDSAIGQVTIQRDLDGTISIIGFEVYPCSISSQTSVNDYCPTLFAKDSEDYDRCLSKMDGRWTGVNDTIDYSFMHQDEQDG